MIRTKSNNLRYTTINIFGIEQGADFIVSAAARRSMLARRSKKVGGGEALLLLLRNVVYLFQTFLSKTYITKMFVFHNYFLKVSGLKVATKRIIRTVLSHWCPEEGGMPMEFGYNWKKCSNNNNIFVFNNQTWQNAEWYSQYERMITSYYRSRI